MSEGVNPYNCALPGNLFTGYRSEIGQICSGLGGGKSFVVLGGRQCGKTSLLLEVAKQVESSGIPGKGAFLRYIDLDEQVPHSPEEFFANLYTEITKDCEGAPAWQPVGSKQPYRAFQDRIQEARPALETQSGSSWLAVLMIDSLNHAASVGEVFENLRNLLQSNPLRVHFRLIGTGVPEKLVTEGSPLANILDKIWLRTLDAEEAADLYAVGDVPVGSVDVLSGRHPFLMQALLEQCWHTPDVDLAARRLVRDRGALFRKWIDAMGPDACAVYKVLEESDGAASVADLRKRSKVREIDDAVRVLSFHGVVDDNEDPDRPRIAGTIFRDWFKRNYSTTPAPGKKRFAVALSFPGEVRDKHVEPIANILARKLTDKRVLYDRFHQGEFAMPDLDLHLQRLYHDESELVVVVISAVYDEKLWTGIEWKAIRDLMHNRRPKEIMFLRSGEGNVSGLYRSDGYIDLRHMGNEDVARLILERHQELQATE